MTSKREPVTDMELVAFVDNRLSADRREVVIAQAHNDSTIAARIAVLTEGTPALADAFRPLLADMPTTLEARVRVQALDMAQPSATSNPSRRWFAAGMAIAASFAIGAVTGGLFMQKTGLTSNWRDAVAQYHALYGPATTAGLNPQTVEINQQLALVSKALGVSLAGVENTVPGLSFKRAQVLDFEGAPLIQIVFETADRTAVAFCLKRSRDAARTATLDPQHGLALASWTRNGIDELVVARLPQDQLLMIAQSLERRA